MLSLWLMAQSDTSKTILLDATVVKDSSETKRIGISPILSADTFQLTGYNLTEALQLIPGISVMSTGRGNSKPVIRGMYGNRILVLLDELPFSNQQWQDEHGLGLNAMALQKIEVVKGPQGVLYGTEALGGLIHFHTYAAPLPGTASFSSISSFESNGNALGQQLAYAQAAKTRWHRLWLSLENSADYRDGNGNRVLNSRYDAYRFRYSTGRQYQNRTSSTSFFTSLNRNGFIFQDLNTFLIPDEIGSRNLVRNPNHMVVLNRLDHEEVWLLRKTDIVKFNASVSANQRMENEGSGKISLNMLLLNAQYRLRWDRTLSTRSKLSIAQSTLLESNTNLGARILVPDSRQLNLNLGAVYTYLLSSTSTLEAGLGTGYTLISTLAKTGTAVPIQQEIGPFHKQSPFANASVSLKKSFAGAWKAELQTASGVRVPNLAELASEGLHEGVYTYEIGSPNLKNERLYSLTASLNYERKKVNVQVSPFVQRFHNYIYLAPDGSDWFGFPVYRFKQDGVNQVGVEGFAAIQFQSKWLAQMGIAWTKSQTDQGAFLPFTPPLKVSPSLRYGNVQIRNWGFSFQANAEVLAKAAYLFPEEVGSSSYCLVNLVLESRYNTSKTSWQFTIGVKNVLNEAYFDHLSRLKNFGVLNPGRSVNFQLKLSRAKK